MSPKATVRTLAPQLEGKSPEIHTWIPCCTTVTLRPHTLRRAVLAVTVTVMTLPWREPITWPLQGCHDPSVAGANHVAPPRAGGLGGEVPLREKRVDLVNC